MQFLRNAARHEIGILPAGMDTRKKKPTDRVTKLAPIFEETGKKKRRRIGLPEPQFVSFRISILQFAKNFLPHTSKVTDAQVIFSLHPSESWEFDVFFN